MNKKCIFVNGGLGFLGCFISLELIKKGFNVIIVDRMVQLAHMRDGLYSTFVNERLSLLKEHDVTIVTMDIDNSEKYLKLLEKYSPVAIYCMNAVTDVKFCNTNPNTAITENIAKVENILNYISKTNTNIRVVFASSASAYGHFSKKEVDETSPLEPVNIYGYSKMASEKLIQLYNHIYGIPYTIIRSSSPYGPLRVNKTITQIIIEKAIRDEIVYINGDGETKLDFTYVSDTVQGFVLGGTKKGASNQIFNISYGEARTLNNLLKIAKTFFTKLKIEYKPQDNAAANRGTLKISKAKHLLNYHPQVSLENGYSKYIEWYLNGNYAKLL